MPKVVVIYLSTSGNTKAMADAIVEGAKSRNIDAEAFNFHEAKIDQIKSADAIAIGSSTFHYKMLPLWKNLLIALETQMFQENREQLLALMAGAEKHQVWSLRKCEQ